jgi:hypothetical protein
VEHALAVGKAEVAGLAGGLHQLDEEVAGLLAELEIADHDPRRILR